MGSPLVCEKIQSIMHKCRRVYDVCIIRQNAISVISYDQIQMFIHFCYLTV